MRARPSAWWMKSWAGMLAVVRLGGTGGSAAVELCPRLIVSHEFRWRCVATDTDSVSARSCPSDMTPWRSGRR
jgi:hypothetical protein